MVPAMHVCRCHVHSCRLAEERHCVEEFGRVSVHTACIYPCNFPAAIVVAPAGGSQVAVLIDGKRKLDVGNFERRKREPHNEPGDDITKPYRPPKRGR